MHFLHKLKNTCSHHFRHKIIIVHQSTSLLQAIDWWVWSDTNNAAVYDHDATLIIFVGIAVLNNVIIELKIHS